MRILQIIQKPQLRGAEIFACQLSVRLMEMGHEVLVVTLFKGSADLPYNLNFVHLNLPGRKLLDFQGWKKLAATIRDYAPDIVQANASDNLKYSVLSKLLYGWNVPIVFRNANKVSGFINSRSKYFFNKFLTSRLSYVVSVSHLCEEDFKSTYRYSKSKITTIPIGVDLTISPSKFPDDLVDVEKGRRILINVGSLVPEKNHAGLIRIFKSIHKKAPDCCLLILGGGSERDKIVSLINELELNDHVFLLGYRNDVLSIVQKAALFMMPSFIEGLPGVILESFLVGTPVVANNVGGISEVVIDRQTGRLIEAGDERLFVKACLDLLQNPKEAQSLSKKALALVKRDYSNDSISERFVRVYQELLS